MAKDIKKIITLDSLADHIDIFNFDCKLVKQIKPHEKFDENDRKDLIIFGFAWSERQ